MADPPTVLGVIPPGDLADNRGSVLSPLSGSYLLIVISEPQCQQHKNSILTKITKGLLSWDEDKNFVDIQKELQNIAKLNLEGELQRGGERLIQYASENLVTEVLIHPQVNTLQQCLRNLLSSFTKYRHIIHAGYAFAHNGSWVLQDGTFSFSDMTAVFSEYEVQRVHYTYQGCITNSIHCAPTGLWSPSEIPKEPFSKLCKVQINPDDKISTTVEIANFVNYLSTIIMSQTVDDILEASDLVGNIRFARPTLYVFPAGQGDSALFGINGFNLLVDGGYNRKACFWDFTRHLDRLDAVLVTRLNSSNVMGITNVVKRKAKESIYPQIGHIFCNVSGNPKVPKNDKDNDLLINVWNEGHLMRENLRQIGLKPHLCFRENILEPINLYHKVGHGKLDMYVLNPAKNSNEVKDFMKKWSDNLSPKEEFVSYKIGKRILPCSMTNLNSICALLLWQPNDPTDILTRILFPGSTPQPLIFEGLDKLKHLECLKYSTCSAKSIKLSSEKKSKIIEKNDMSGITKNMSPSHTYKSRREESIKRYNEDRRKEIETQKSRKSESLSREQSIERKINKKLIARRLRAKQEESSTKITKNILNGSISESAKEPKAIKKEHEKIVNERKENKILDSTKAYENVTEDMETKDSSLVSVESGVILLDDRESSLDIEQSKEPKSPKKEEISIREKKDRINEKKKSMRSVKPERSSRKTAKYAEKEKILKPKSESSKGEIKPEKEIFMGSSKKDMNDKLRMKEFQTKETRITAIKDTTTTTKKERLKKVEKAKVTTPSEPKPVKKIRPKAKKDDLLDQTNEVNAIIQDDVHRKGVIGGIALNIGSVAAAVTGMSVVEASTGKDDSEIYIKGEDELILAEIKDDSVGEQDFVRVSDIANIPGVHEISVDKDNKIYTEFNRNKEKIDDGPEKETEYIKEVESELNADEIELTKATLFETEGTKNYGETYDNNILYKIEEQSEKSHTCTEPIKTIKNIEKLPKEEQDEEEKSSISEKQDEAERDVATKEEAWKSKNIFDGTHVQNSIPDQTKDIITENLNLKEVSAEYPKPSESELDKPEIENLQVNKKVDITQEDKKVTLDRVPIKESKISDFEKIEIIKTPDEVDDLPIHEEVDVALFENEKNYVNVAYEVSKLISHEQFLSEKICDVDFTKLDIATDDKGDMVIPDEYSDIKVGKESVDEEYFVKNKTLLEMAEEIKEKKVDNHDKVSVDIAREISKVIDSEILLHEQIPIKEIDQEKTKEVKEIFTSEKSEISETSKRHVEIYDEGKDVKTASDEYETKVNVKDIQINMKEKLILSDIENIIEQIEQTADTHKEITATDKAEEWEIIKKESFADVAYGSKQDSHEAVCEKSEMVGESYQDNLDETKIIDSEVNDVSDAIKPKIIQDKEIKDDELLKELGAQFESIKDKEVLTVSNDALANMDEISIQAKSFVPNNRNKNDLSRIDSADFTLEYLIEQEKIIRIKEGYSSKIAEEIKGFSTETNELNRYVEIESGVPFHESDLEKQETIVNNLRPISTKDCISSKHAMNEEAKLDIFIDKEISKKFDSETKNIEAPLQKIEQTTDEEKGKMKDVSALDTLSQNTLAKNENVEQKDNDAIGLNHQVGIITDISPEIIMGGKLPKETLFEDKIIGERRMSDERAFGDIISPITMETLSNLETPSEKSSSTDLEPVISKRLENIENESILKSTATENVETTHPPFKIKEKYETISSVTEEVKVDTVTEVKEEITLSASRKEEKPISPITSKEKILEVSLPTIEQEEKYIFLPDSKNEETVEKTSPLEPKVEEFSSLVTQENIDICSTKGEEKFEMISPASEKERVELISPVLKKVSSPVSGSKERIDKESFIEEKEKPSSSIRQDIIGLTEQHEEEQNIEGFSSLLKKEKFKSSLLDKEQKEKDVILPKSDKKTEIISSFNEKLPLSTTQENIYLSSREETIDKISSVIEKGVKVISPSWENEKDEMDTTLKDKEKTLSLTETKLEAALSVSKESVNKTKEEDEKIEGISPFTEKVESISIVTGQKEKFEIPPDTAKVEIISSSTEKPEITSPIGDKIIEQVQKIETISFVAEKNKIEEILPLKEQKEKLVIAADSEKEEKIKVMSDSEMKEKSEIIISSTLHEPEKKVKLISPDLEEKFEIITPSTLHEAEKEVKAILLDAKSEEITASTVEEKVCVTSLKENIKLLMPEKEKEEIFEIISPEPEKKSEEILDSKSGETATILKEKIELPPSPPKEKKIDVSEPKNKNEMSIISLVTEQEENVDDPKEVEVISRVKATEVGLSLSTTEEMVDLSPNIEKQLQVISPATSEDKVAEQDKADEVISPVVKKEETVEKSSISTEKSEIISQVPKSEVPLLNKEGEKIEIISTLKEKKAEFFLTGEKVDTGLHRKEEQSLEVSKEKFEATLLDTATEQKLETISPISEKEDLHSPVTEKNASFDSPGKQEQDLEVKVISQTADLEKEVEIVSVETEKAEIILSLREDTTDLSLAVLNENIGKSLSEKQVEKIGSISPVSEQPATTPDIEKEAKLSPSMSVKMNELSLHEKPEKIELISTVHEEDNKVVLPLHADSKVDITFSTKEHEGKLKEVISPMQKHEKELISHFQTEVSEEISPIIEREEKEEKIISTITEKIDTILVKTEHDETVAVNLVTANEDKVVNSLEKGRKEKIDVDLQHIEKKVELSPTALPEMAESSVHKREKDKIEIISQLSAGVKVISSCAEKEDKDEIISPGSEKNVQVPLQMVEEKIGKSVLKNQEETLEIISPVPEKVNEPSEGQLEKLPISEKLMEQTSIAIETKVSKDSTNEFEISSDNEQEKNLEITAPITEKKERMNVLCQVESKITSQPLFSAKEEEETRVTLDTISYKTEDTAKHEGIIIPQENITELDSVSEQKTIISSTSKPKQDITFSTEEPEEKLIDTIISPSQKQEEKEPILQLRTGESEEISPSVEREEVIVSPVPKKIDKSLTKKEHDEKGEVISWDTAKEDKLVTSLGKEREEKIDIDSQDIEKKVELPSIGLAEMTEASKHKREKDKTEMIPQAPKVLEIPPYAETEEKDDVISPGGEVKKVQLPLQVVEKKVDEVSVKNQEKELEVISTETEKLNEQGEEQQEEVLLIDTKIEKKEEIILPVNENLVEQASKTIETRVGKDSSIEKFEISSDTEQEKNVEMTAPITERIEQIESEIKLKPLSSSANEEEIQITSDAIPHETKGTTKHGDIITSQEDITKLDSVSEQKTSSTSKQEEEDITFSTEEHEDKLKNASILPAQEQEETESILQLLTEESEAILPSVEREEIIVSLVPKKIDTILTNKEHEEKGEEISLVTAKKDKEVTLLDKEREEKLDIVSQDIEKKVESSSKGLVETTEASDHKREEDKKEIIPQVSAGLEVIPSYARKEEDEVISPGSERKVQLPFQVVEEKADESSFKNQEKTLEIISTETEKEKINEPDEEQQEEVLLLDTKIEKKKEIILPINEKLVEQTSTTIETTVGKDSTIEKFEISSATEQEKSVETTASTTEKKEQIDALSQVESEITSKPLSSSVNEEETPVTSDAISHETKDTTKHEGIMISQEDITKLDFESERKTTSSTPKHEQENITFSTEEREEELKDARISPTQKQEEKESILQLRTDESVEISPSVKREEVIVSPVPKTIDNGLTRKEHDEKVEVISLVTAKKDKAIISFGNEIEEKLDVVSQDIKKEVESPFTALAEMTEASEHKREEDIMATIPQVAAGLEVIPSYAETEEKDEVITTGSEKIVQLPLQVVEEKIDESSVKNQGKTLEIISTAKEKVNKPGKEQQKEVVLLDTNIGKKVEITLPTNKKLIEQTSTIIETKVGKDSTIEKFEILSDTEQEKNVELTATITEKIDALFQEEPEITSKLLYSSASEEEETRITSEDKIEKIAQLPAGLKVLSSHAEKEEKDELISSGSEKKVQLPLQWDEEKFDENFVKNLEKTLETISTVAGKEKVNETGEEQQEEVLLLDTKIEKTKEIILPVNEKLVEQASTTIEPRVGKDSTIEKFEISSDTEQEKNVEITAPITERIERIDALCQVESEIKLKPLSSSTNEVEPQITSDAMPHETKDTTKHRGIIKPQEDITKLDSVSEQRTTSSTSKEEQEDITFSTEEYEDKLKNASILLAQEEKESILQLLTEESEEISPSVEKEVTVSPVTKNIEKIPTKENDENDEVISLVTANKDKEVTSHDKERQEKLDIVSLDIKKDVESPSKGLAETTEASELKREKDKREIIPQVRAGFEVIPCYTQKGEEDKVISPRSEKKVQLPFQVVEEKVDKSSAENQEKTLHIISTVTEKEKINEPCKKQKEEVPLLDTKIEKKKEIVLPINEKLVEQTPPIETTVGKDSTIKKLEISLDTEQEKNVEITASTIERKEQVDALSQVESEITSKPLSSSANEEEETGVMSEITSNETKESTKHDDIMISQEDITQLDSESQQNTITSSTSKYEPENITFSTEKREKKLKDARISPAPKQEEKKSILQLRTEESVEITPSVEREEAIVSLVLKKIDNGETKEEHDEKVEIISLLTAKEDKAVISFDKEGKEKLDIVLNDYEKEVESPSTALAEMTEASEHKREEDKIEIIPQALAGLEVIPSYAETKDKDEAMSPGSEKKVQLPLQVFEEKIDEISVKTQEKTLEIISTVTEKEEINEPGEEKQEEVLLIDTKIEKKKEIILPVKEKFVEQASATIETTVGKDSTIEKFEISSDTEQEKNIERTTERKEQIDALSQVESDITSKPLSSSANEEEETQVTLDAILHATKDTAKHEGIMISQEVITKLDSVSEQKTIKSSTSKQEPENITFSTEEHGEKLKDASISPAPKQEEKESILQLRTKESVEISPNVEREEVIVSLVPKKIDNGETKKDHDKKVEIISLVTAAKDKAVISLDKEREEMIDIVSNDTEKEVESLSTTLAEMTELSEYKREENKIEIIPQVLAGLEVIKSYAETEEKDEVISPGSEKKVQLPLQVVGESSVKNQEKTLEIISTVTEKEKIYEPCEEKQEKVLLIDTKIEKKKETIPPLKEKLGEQDSATLETRVAKDSTIEKVEISLDTEQEKNIEIPAAITKRKEQIDALCQVESEITSKPLSTSANEEEETRVTSDAIPYETKDTTKHEGIIISQEDITKLNSESEQKTIASSTSKQEQEDITYSTEKHEVKLKDARISPEQKQEEKVSILQLGTEESAQISPSVEREEVIISPVSKNIDNGETKKEHDEKVKIISLVTANDKAVISLDKERDEKIDIVSNDTEKEVESPSTTLAEMTEASEHKREENKIEIIPQVLPGLEVIPSYAKTDERDEVISPGSEKKVQLPLQVVGEISVKNQEKTLEIISTVTEKEKIYESGEEKQEEVLLIDTKIEKKKEFILPVKEKLVEQASATIETRVDKDSTIEKVEISSDTEQKKIIEITPAITERKEQIDALCQVESEITSKPLSTSANEEEETRVTSDAIPYETKDTTKHEDIIISQKDIAKLNSESEQKTITSSTSRQEQEDITFSTKKHEEKLKDARISPAQKQEEKESILQLGTEKSAQISPSVEREEVIISPVPKNIDNGEAKREHDEKVKIISLVTAKEDKAVISLDKEREEKLDIVPHDTKKEVESASTALAEMTEASEHKREEDKIDIIPQTPAGLEVIPPYEETEKKDEVISPSSEKKVQLPLQVFEAKVDEISVKNQEKTLEIISTVTEKENEPGEEKQEEVLLIDTKIEKKKEIILPVKEKFVELASVTIEPTVGKDSTIEKFEISSATEQEKNIERTAAITERKEEINALSQVESDITSKPLSSSANEEETRVTSDAVLHETKDTTTHEGIMISQEVITKFDSVSEQKTITSSTSKHEQENITFSTEEHGEKLKDARISPAPKKEEKESILQLRTEESVEISPNVEREEVIVSLVPKKIDNGETKKEHDKKVEIISLVTAKDKTVISLDKKREEKIDIVSNDTEKEVESPATALEEMTEVSEHKREKDKIVIIPQVPTGLEVIPSYAETEEKEAMPLSSEKQIQFPLQGVEEKAEKSSFENQEETLDIILTDTGKQKVIEPGKKQQKNAVLLDTKIKNGEIMVPINEKLVEQTSTVLETNVGKGPTNEKFEIQNNVDITTPITESKVQMGALYQVGSEITSKSLSSSENEKKETRVTSDAISQKTKDTIKHEGIIISQETITKLDSISEQKTMSSTSKQERYDATFSSKELENKLKDAIISPAEKESISQLQTELTSNIRKGQLEIKKHETYHRTLEEVTSTVNHQEILRETNRISHAEDDQITNVISSVLEPPKESFETDYSADAKETLKNINDVITESVVSRLQHFADTELDRNESRETQDNCEENEAVVTIDSTLQHFYEKNDNKDFSLSSPTAEFGGIKGTSPEVSEYDGSKQVNNLTDKETEILIKPEYDSNILEDTQGDYYYISTKTSNNIATYTLENDIEQTVAIELDEVEPKEIAKWINNIDKINYDSTGSTEKVKGEIRMVESTDIEIDEKSNKKKCDYIEREIDQYTETKIKDKRTILSKAIEQPATEKGDYLNLKTEEIKSQQVDGITFSKESIDKTKIALVVTKPSFDLPTVIEEESASRDQLKEANWIKKQESSSCESSSRDENSDVDSSSSSKTKSADDRYFEKPRIKKVKGSKIKTSVGVNILESSDSETEKSNVKQKPLKNNSSDLFEAHENIHEPRKVTDGRKFESETDSVGSKVYQTEKLQSYPSETNLDIVGTEVVIESPIHAVLTAENAELVTLSSDNTPSTERRVFEIKESAEDNKSLEKTKCITFNLEKTTIIPASSLYLEEELSLPIRENVEKTDSSDSLDKPEVEKNSTYSKIKYRSMSDKTYEIDQAVGTVPEIKSKEYQEEITKHPIGEMTNLVESHSMKYDQPDKCELSKRFSSESSESPEYEKISHRYVVKRESIQSEFDEANDTLKTITQLEPQADTANVNKEDVKYIESQPQDKSVTLCEQKDISEHKEKTVNMEETSPSFAEFSGEQKDAIKEITGSSISHKTRESGEIVPGSPRTGRVVVRKVTTVITKYYENGKEVETEEIPGGEVVEIVDSSETNESILQKISDSASSSPTVLRKFSDKIAREADTVLNSPIALVSNKTIQSPKNLSTSSKEQEDPQPCTDKNEAFVFSQDKESTIFTKTKDEAEEKMRSLVTETVFNANKDIVENLKEIEEQTSFIKEKISSAEEKMNKTAENVSHITKILPLAKEIKHTANKFTVVEGSTAYITEKNFRGSKEHSTFTDTLSAITEITPVKEETIYNTENVNKIENRTSRVGKEYIRVNKKPIEEPVIALSKESSIVQTEILEEAENSSKHLKQSSLSTSEDEVSSKEDFVLDAVEILSAASKESTTVKKELSYMEKSFSEIVNKSLHDGAETSKITTKQSCESSAAIQSILKEESLLEKIKNTDASVDSQEEKTACSLSTKVESSVKIEKENESFSKTQTRSSENIVDPLETLKSWGKPMGLPSPIPLTVEQPNQQPPKDEKPRTKKAKKITQAIYMDLAYVPHSANPNYVNKDFFNRIRARYYVFSSIDPGREVLDALLRAKMEWDDKELEVTIIPTYDTDALGFWVAANEEALIANKIDLAPSAVRCTINLQDHETSCNAYRLEF